MARFILIVVMCTLPCWVSAQNGSLFAARIKPSALLAHHEAAVRRNSASLFSGTAAHSLFAPWPEKHEDTRARPHIKLSRSSAKLLDLIAMAEAGSAGYDAVQYGATVKPAKRPTQLTLGEIFDWIATTPRQPHAIGRYQFIPDTLARLVALKGYPRSTRFTPKVQDQLALILLQDAGLAAFEAKTLPRRAFMKNLARIWAGLPLPSGKSYYQGYAGNKATMSFARFEAGMARIF